MIGFACHAATPTSICNAEMVAITEARRSVTFTTNELRYETLRRRGQKRRDAAADSGSLDRSFRDCVHVCGGAEVHPRFGSGGVDGGDSFIVVRPSRQVASSETARAVGAFLVGLDCRALSGAARGVDRRLTGRPSDDAVHPRCPVATARRRRRIRHGPRP
jgi:hypothetical protein